MNAKERKKHKKEKEYLLQNLDKTSEERKNKTVSLALVTREDKDILLGIDFIQKGSDIKENNLKEWETISKAEIDKNLRTERNRWGWQRLKNWRKKTSYK